LNLSLTNNRYLTTQSHKPNTTNSRQTKHNPLLRCFHFSLCFINYLFQFSSFPSNPLFYSFKLLIVNVFSSSCFFANFCFSLVSTMEAKLLNATTLYKPSIPFSSFHLTTPRSCFSFNPISYFPQKSNLSVKAQAASIG
jgi:hypothetical protein